MFAALRPFAAAEDYIANDGAQHYHLANTPLGELNAPSLTRADLQAAKHAISEAAYEGAAPASQGAQ